MSVSSLYKMALPIETIFLSAHFDTIYSVDAASAAWNLCGQKFYACKVLTRPLYRSSAIYKQRNQS